jgi:hypothetical protein
LDALQKRAPKHQSPTANKNGIYNIVIKYAGLGTYEEIGHNIELGNQLYSAESGLQFFQFHPETGKE